MLSRLRQYVSGKIMGGYLPCYVFAWRPLVIFAYDTDFLKNTEAFATQFRKFNEVFLFLQLGWQHEKRTNAEKFAGEVLAVCADLPMLKVTVLTNSPQEESLLRELGLNAVFCHQNAFLDEKKYSPKFKKTKEFDAVYIARITPFKRHELAKKISSLRLIGDYHLRERERLYAEGVLKELGHAERTAKVSASKIPAELGRCCCGLCLSEEEGAMFVSAEYMLCGLPVVNTKNIGGRDWLFPDFAVKQVEDTPEAVALAVDEWVKNPISPQKIRNGILEKMYQHRETLQKLLGAIRPEFAKAAARMPNKLGLRCTKMPWVNWKHGLKSK